MEELGFENANVYYLQNFLSAEESEQIFKLISDLFQYESNKDILGDNHEAKYKINRKTMVFIDESIDNQIIPKIWGHDVTIVNFPPELLMVKIKLELLLGEKYKFNICLANYYDNGKKTIGWHCDNEEKGNTNCIASISLGAEREFHFRKNNTKEIYRSITLQHGSLFLMGEGCQEHYQHCLPINKLCTEPRLNLTFRIFDNDKYQQY